MTQDDKTRRKQIIHETAHAVATLYKLLKDENEKQKSVLKEADDIIRNVMLLEEELKDIEDREDAEEKQEP